MGGTEWLSVLENDDRRQLLVRLLHGNPERRLGIATDMGTSPAERVSVETEMYRTHLPLLVEHGLVNWNRDEDVVTRGPAFDEVRPLLELLDGQSTAFSEALIAAVRGVTERLQEELQSTTDRCERLRAENDRLSEFAQQVSHDLRSPLTVASLRLELARDSVDSEHLEKAADALERMEARIDETLTLAREGRVIQAGEPVSLREVVNDVEETFEANVEVCHDALDGPEIVADRSRLVVLLENLFRNAVDHSTTLAVPAVEHSTTPGASVPNEEPDVPNERPDVSVRVGSLPEGFYVADDGPGIPPADRERVFEDGYSTSEDGSGLGLGIVREIADAHGWTLTVTSSADGGARFEVRGVELAAKIP
ncbi:sensor histidine kinase [Haloarchaeobius sp. TZWWS8]|uniref:sensor histidine kinase n=1 Tax=Haloarchaeobius sp. TZWWS8 TaxID=3446121 RepID=UPI003EB77532